MFFVKITIVNVKWVLYSVGARISKGGSASKANLPMFSTQRAKYLEVCFTLDNMHRIIDKDDSLAC